MGGLALGPLGQENSHTDTYIHIRRGVFECVFVPERETHKEELKYIQCIVDVR